MTREDKLIEKLENGDMSALDELISLYYTDILRYCICHTADRQTAEDAVQETFLKTVRYLDRYIHKGKFRAFLYQVAANTCVDMWRKKHQEEQIPDTLECLERGFQRAETETDFMLLVRELPAEQREIIYLRFAHDLTLREIGQILNQNEKETQKAKESLMEQCFMSAEAISYMIQGKPDIVGNQQEIQRIAGMLQVDEVHLFDTEGNLYAGSEPRYYGLNFNSGEQMRFFLPMLKDYDLRLCQEITPNTAEQKLMQYAAVWSRDHKGIVQVGLEPTTVLEAMKKTELSYIFSLVTSEKDETIYAIDPDSGLCGPSAGRTGRGKRDVRTDDGLAFPEKGKHEGV